MIDIIISEMSRRYFIVRNTAITILKRPFITVGKAKGLNARTIKYTYVGKNSFFPLLITTAISIGNMMEGTILIEIVFSYPGIGFLAYIRYK